MYSLFFVWRFLPVSLRRIFTLNHRNLLTVAVGVRACRHCLGFKLYTNQIKFDFGANFSEFQIPV